MQYAKFASCVGCCSLIACATLLLMADVAWCFDDGAVETASPADEIVPPTFLAAWGTQGEEDGQFLSPMGIAMTAADDVYVTDPHKNCVQRFTSDGKFLDKFVTGEFPGGIAIDREGLIYVAVMMGHKISVFRRKAVTPNEEEPAAPYELVREWGSKGTEDGQFDQPGGIVFGRDGSLVVCDQVNHRVQIFSPEGKFLTKWGEYGDQPGQFGAPERPYNRVGGPCMPAIDRAGNIYTTEPTAGRIQKFSPEGMFLGAWGSNETRAGAFRGNNGLRGPIALLFDREDRLWVSATNHRVQLFTADGHYLTGLGTTAVSGDGPGQFRVPHTMAFDSHGVLYVADLLNYRVQKFAVPAAATPAP